MRSASVLGLNGAPIGDFTARIGDPTGKQDALALWCPTADDKTVSGFKLPVKASKATVVRFATGSITGVEAPLANLTLDVSEKPTLVFLTR